METEQSYAGMSPPRWETNEVLSFVGAALPEPPASVLEVGCGTGQLALKLKLRGFDVEAIGPNSQAIEAARHAGVTATCTDLLAFSGGPFDAVIFTRSLHHISPLDAALEKARHLVVPGGVLVVDEFAHDAVDPASAKWFYEMLSLLDESGALPHAVAVSHQHGVAAKEAPALGSALEFWKLSHAHPALHGGHAMLEALDGAFTVKTVARVPSLYRFFSERLERNELGARLLEAVHRLERAFIASDLIVPTGLRVVAQRPA